MTEEPVAAIGARSDDPPLVTIMIPTYGQALLLPQAVESALKQDYPNLEVVVVDDASPDDSATVIRRFRDDPRLRYVRHDTNLGRVATYRDTLHRLARGEFVLNLDGDDWLCDATYISSAMRLVDLHPEIAMVFARAASFDGATNTYVESDLNRGRPSVIDGMEIALGYADNSAGVPHLTALYRRAVAIDRDFYRHDVIGSDSISLLALLAGSRVGFVDKVVAVWRRHEGNASRFASIEDLMANFAVADVPANDFEKRGLLAPAASRWWRRRVSAALGHRQLANFLVAGERVSALRYAFGMVKSRPLAAAQAFGMLMISATRKIAKSSSR